MTALKRRPMKAGTINKVILAERAPYIAGLLDGEGTFTIRWNKRARSPNFQPLIMVQMNHEGVIEHLAETFKVTYEQKTRKNHPSNYVLRVTTRDDIVTILEALMPHLIVKKEHAEIILELVDLKERGELTLEIAYDMAQLYLRIRQINTKGPSFDPDKLRSDLYQHIENYFK